MSERAQEDLVDEIEILGPVRISQVESAQQEVVRVVRELEAAGEIVLVRGDEQLVQ
jgi:flagellar motor switch protein FliG